MITQESVSEDRQPRLDETRARAQTDAHIQRYTKRERERLKFHFKTVFVLVA